MRTILILVSLLPVVACHGGGSSTGVDASVGGDASAGPDAGVPPDALPPIPVVAPCGLLGLPGAPSMDAGGTRPVLRDVDGDGKLDLVVIDGQLVRVSPGNGDATFGASVTTLLSLSISSIAIADVNGDGKLDLFVSFTSSDDAIMVALGDGTGRFTPGPLISGPSYPMGIIQGIALADLNGDGKLDLVVAYPFTARVGTRLGTGDGTFGDETSSAVGAGPSAVAVADLDGDGAIDVIAANASSVSILRGKGDGTFADKIDRDTLGAGLVAADLNGDGKVDLVVQSTLGISVLMNDGNGVLRDHVDYPSPSVGIDSLTLAVGDVNSDGKLDVVASRFAGASAANVGYLVVFAGNGDGTLEPAVATPVSALSEIAVGDVNGDHALDVIVSSSDARASVLESDGRGGFLSPTMYAPNAYSAAVVTADLDHDGYVDVVLAGIDIGVALGRSEGRFADLVKYPAAAAGAPLVQDVTGDGVADLVWSSQVGSGGSIPGARLGVLPGNGDGSFRAGVETAFAARSTYLFALGDLTGDGKTDLVIAADSSTTLHLGEVSVYVGNDDGSFHLGGEPAVIDGIPTLLRLDDANGDGRLDVVAGHRRVCRTPDCSPRPYPPGRDGISLLLNSGDGTLQAAVPYTGTGGSPIGPLMVDITGDGKLDIVKASSIGVEIVPGNGDGSFQPTLLYRYPVTGPFDVADIDRDGRLDVVTPGNGFTNGFFVLFARCVR